MLRVVPRVTVLLCIIYVHCRYQTHFFSFRKSLSANFVDKVGVAFELIMIRENILSVPGVPLVPLTTEDCNAVSKS